MRLRTAAGLALASLTAAVTVMAVDAHRAGSSTEADSVHPAVIVIDNPAWWECEEPSSAAQ